MRLTLSWSERNTHPRAAQVVNAAGELRVGRECLVEERKHDDPDTQLSGSARQFARAREVQALLADSGRHRGIPPADLLIAAAAADGSVPVLHYDHDHDLIAEVNGQVVRWILPAGLLPWQQRQTNLAIL